MKKFVHHTAILDKNVRIGNNSKIWHWTHLSENVKIGENYRAKCFYRKKRKNFFECQNPKQCFCL